MTIALIRAVRKAGGVPFAQTYRTRVEDAYALYYKVARAFVRSSSIERKKRELGAS